MQLGIQADTSNLGRDQIPYRGVYSGAIHSLSCCNSPFITYWPAITLDLATLCVPDAAYNRRGPRNNCLPGTREAVIAKIVEWIDHGNNPICWLSGPAGFGKSAITQTIAERCATDGTLAGSFFFLRGAGSRSEFTRFITTLAYQLTLSVPTAKPAIQSALQNDPSIPYQSIEDQFRKLIIGPIVALEEPICPMVVVVDALDECSDTKSIGEFIDVLARLFSDRRLSLRFLLTSRAEDHIRQQFCVGATHSATYVLALENFDAHVDIRSFLESRFSTIYAQNTRLMCDIPQPWPSAKDLLALVEKSSGVFIFASTLVDFITDDKGAPPQQKLKDILMLHAGLDPLYIQVLSAAPSVNCFRRVLAAIVLLREQLSITSLACLLRLGAEKIVHALLGIQSIIKVPEDNDKPVVLNHASLGDFLIEKERSKGHFIDPSTSHASIVLDCLKLMTNGFRRDVFPTEHAQLYACRNWCFHLNAAITKGGAVIPGSELVGNLKDFFTSQSCEVWVNILILDDIDQDVLGILKDVILKLNVSPVLDHLLSC